MIALVRHGQTAWNVEGRIHGSSDVPLNATGRQQASSAADQLVRLEETGIARWRAVVTSPLARARETAQIIANRLDCAHPVVVPEWVEQDYGVGEGMLAEELWAAWPAYDQPGKEHDDDVAVRGVLALNETRDRFRDGDVVVVAHGNIIRYGLERLTERRLPFLGNGDVSVVEHTADGWRVVTVGGVPIASVRTPTDQP